jgi:cholesterol transport system auxiliary component
MKRFTLPLSLSAMLLLGGCFSSHFYVLSNPSPSIHSVKNHIQSIGVERVRVPKYLFKREIAIAKSQSEILFLSNASWAEDMDEGLTKRLIAFLQKKFQQPSVYLYPWDTDSQPQLKLSLNITHFIAYNNHISLDASYTIENMKTGKKVARLFSTTLPTTMESSTIVSTMDKAFYRLEEAIAKTLHAL